MKGRWGRSRSGGGDKPEVEEGERGAGEEEIARSTNGCYSDWARSWLITLKWKETLGSQPDLPYWVDQ